MTTSGDMAYLQMKSNLGANLQYVKNTFRLSFNLPLSLNYTKVDNEPIANETTTGKRMTLLFSPSLQCFGKQRIIGRFLQEGVMVCILRTGET